MKKWQVQGDKTERPNDAHTNDERVEALGSNTQANSTENSPKQSNGTATNSAELEKTDQEVILFMTVEC